MDTWKKALDNRDCGDVANVDEDIEIDNEQSKLDPKRADTTEYPTRDFVTLSEVKYDRS